jgi:hypothetical protein
MTIFIQTTSLIACFLLIPIGLILKKGDKQRSIKSIVLRFLLCICSWFLGMNLLFLDRNGEYDFVTFLGVAMAMFAFDLLLILVIPIVLVVYLRISKKRNKSRHSIVVTFCVIELIVIILPCVVFVIFLPESWHLLLRLLSK